MTAEFLLSEIKAYENTCEFGNCLRLANQGIKEFPEQTVFLDQVGRFLLLQGRVPEALAFFERFLRKNPADWLLDSNILYYQHFLTAHSAQDLYERHLAWVKRQSPRLPSQPTDGNDQARTSHQKIRLGFVSSDFRRHPVAYFIEPLLRELDRHRFEITCYSRKVSADEVTSQLRSLPLAWKEFAYDDLARMTKVIREDHMDLLIDLNGHTPHHCLEVFAAKPARLQATYLGYPNTTGLPEMDFRFVDGFSDPCGTADALNSEQLVRLPESAWCYQPPAAPVADWNPASVANGYITFGSFNALAKLSDFTLRLWATLLERVPTSRLLVKNYALTDREGRRAFLTRAIQAGLPEKRLDLMGALPQSLFMQAYRLADIALDPTPYHGTTTTCESLWMGVPVVTLAGDSHVSRVGVSLLHQAGLDELVADDRQGYIEKAANLAENRLRLNSLHHELRNRLAKSTLLSPSRFTRQFESVVEVLVKEGRAG